MNTYTCNGGGEPPTSITWRYCPKSPFHWKTEGERCPVCKSKIKVTTYSKSTE